jgi:bifunctional non-homologous end joining protein LigD
VFCVPLPLIPMAPMLVRPPFHRDGWVYQEKVDGWRMLAYKQGSRVRLISRQAVDHTSRFRDLAAAIAKIRIDVAVLDGEVAVYDEKLVSRFHLIGDQESGVLCTPPVYIAFDVLQVGHRDVRGRPLRERREVLEDLLADVDMVLPCRQLPDDGSKAWAMVEDRGYEGMVAKDPRSTYRSGPTRSWVKVKVRHEDVFVVGGIRNVDAFDGVLVGRATTGVTTFPARRIASASRGSSGRSPSKKISSAITRGAPPPEPSPGAPGPGDASASRARA